MRIERLLNGDIESWHIDPQHIKEMITDKLQPDLVAATNPTAFTPPLLHRDRQLAPVEHELDRRDRAFTEWRL